jgi:glycosyltransferase involved in cell wall biosynthesis
MLSGETKISVVVPLFNKEKFVGEAIRSILSQELPCDEIIVVDDGSTDGSVEAVKRIGHPLIKLISQPNAGVSAARNTGIEHAQGEWIAFLDADDQWLPGFLVRIRQLMREFPASRVCATSFFIRNLSTGAMQTSSPSNLTFIAETGEIGNYFQVAISSLPPVHSSAIVVERALIRSIGGFPVGVTSGEDLITWGRLALMTNIAYCRTPYTIFQYDPNLPYRVPQTVDFVGAELRKMILDAPRHRKRWIKKYIGKWHKMRAHSYIGVNYNRKAFAEIRKSIHFSPVSKVWLFIPYMAVRKIFRIFAITPRV